MIKMKFEGDEHKILIEYAINLFNYGLISGSTLQDIRERIQRKHIRMLNRKYPQN